MENHKVNASLISRLTHAFDQIEERSPQNRPLKIVKVRHLRCGRVMVQEALAELERLGLIAADRRPRKSPRIVLHHTQAKQS